MKLGPALENTTSVFATYLDHYEPRPFNILDEYTFGYGLRTVFRLPLGTDRASAEWGGEIYRDQYNWSTYENDYQSNDGNGSLQGDPLSRNRELRNQYFLFGSLSWPLTDRLTVRGGLALNQTRYDYRDLFGTGADNRSARRNFDPVLLPSLDLRYTAPGGSFLYLNISRGFSNPGLEESLNPDGLINPEISQEKGMNYEFGGQWLAAEGRLRLSASAYRMEIRDLLVAERVGDDQFVGRNAGQTRHQGLEFSGEYRATFGNWDLSPYLSYTLSDHSFTDFVDGDDDYSGNRLTGVPRNRVYGGVRLRNRAGIYWNTTYQYVDPIPLRDDTSVFSDPYQLLSMQWGYRKTLSRKVTAELQFGLNNLTNARYASSVLINAGSFGGAEPRYFYPGNDRNYYAGILLLWAL